MTKDDLLKASGDLKAGILSTKQLRELAQSLDLDIPAKISASDLQDMVAAAVSDFLSDQVLAENQADQAENKNDVDLILNEDLDAVSLTQAGGKDIFVRRLGGVRGRFAKQPIKEAEQFAKAKNLVIRRRLRRIQDTDYGL